MPVKIVGSVPSVVYRSRSRPAPASGAASVTETGAEVIQPAGQAPPPQRMLAAGAVESSVTFRVVSLVFAGVQASAAVTTTPKLPVAAFVQLNELETYGPPAGAVTVSAPCVQPLWPTSG